MNFKIVTIPGDGIGPEIVREAQKVLEKVAKVYGHKFCFEKVLMGGCSIDAYGEPCRLRSFNQEVGCATFCH